MADPAKYLGLSCREPGTCPDAGPLAAALEENMTSTSREVSLLECLGGQLCALPGLEKPSFDSCSRDTCTAEDLGAAVMVDGHRLNFKMARAESTTKEPASTVSSLSRTRSTRRPDTTRTTISTSPTHIFTTFTASAPTPTTPAHTTPLPSPPSETAIVPTPQKQDLTTTQTIGIIVGASIVGLFLLGCLVHRILVYIRKRRPGYPHLTDHAPDWQPPVSPVELTEVVAPGTRQCGFGRIPGEATRPRSWEDKGNNEAEAKLGGVAPRRVRSADPAGLLCASPESFEHGDEGQVYEYRAPLRITNGQPPTACRSIGINDPSTSSIYGHQGARHQTEPSSQASSLRGPNSWVISTRHASHHGVYPSQGDYAVNIEPHAQNHRARPAHSADELRRHTAPYNPAARSDDQLNRFVSYPAGEQRPAPRSDGAGRTLGSGQYPPRTYEAYTPPDSEPARQQTQVSVAGNPKVQREVYELSAEPVGEIRDLRARVTLGDVYIVNPNPAHDESTVSEPAAMDEPQGDDGKVKSETPVVEESRSANEAKESVDKEPIVKAAGDDTDEALEEEIEEQGDKESSNCETPDQTLLATSRPESPVGALQAATILCSIATSSSPQKPDELVSREPSAPVSPALAAPSEETPRLDATGGIPFLRESSRQSSISSTARDSRPSVTGTPRRHSGIPSSSTAPTSLASQLQPEANGLRPEDVPRMLAAPRRRASELHIDIPADDGLRRVIHPRVAPLDRQRHYTDQYVPPPGHDYHDRQSGYGTRYPTYPASQPRTQNHNPRHTAPYHPTRQHPPVPCEPHPYAQAYHTRVFYPHRAHPPRSVIPLPPNTTERPRRTAEQLGLGPQPRPAYRTPEGAADLNRGNDIARREMAPGVYQAASYPRAGGDRYSSYGDGGYGGEYSGQYSPAVSRSEYSGPLEEGWGYEVRSAGSEKGSLSSRTWQT